MNGKSEEGNSLFVIHIVKTDIMKAVKLWFDDSKIFIETDSGDVKSQSFKWYPLLKKATEIERKDYSFTDEGIRWEKLDEDISFESFTYDEPNGRTKLKMVFDNFPELNASKVAARMGIPQSVFASYLCGVKTPSEARAKEIEKTLQELGRELLSVSCL